MYIKQISYAILGVAMLACTSGCTKQYVDRAKEQAVEYLSGDEYLKAKNYSEKQNSNNSFSAKAVNYWDNILIKAKSQEAYLKGQQMVKDSAEGKQYSEQSYPLKLDTIFPESCIDKSKADCAQYVDAKILMEYEKRAPKGAGFISSFPGIVHYWNMIRMTGEQREAYEKGKADMRQALFP